MKIKLAFLLFVITAMLTSCSGGGSNDKVTLEKVKQSIEDQGVILVQIIPMGGGDIFDELNKVKATTYAIDPPNAQDNSARAIATGALQSMNVNLYIYNTEQARIEGRKAFDNELALTKFVTIPSVYEKKNAMVVYFKDPNDKTDNDVKLRKAVEAL